jgi:hypothetical protein
MMGKEQIAERKGRRVKSYKYRAEGKGSERHERGICQIP